MLMALRLSKVYPGATDYAATEFKAALADGAGSIETNADNFMLNYPGGNFSHPWYNTYNGRKDFGESKTMTDMLGAFGDGRQSVFGSTVLGGASTKGVPYGWARAKVEAWTAANSDWAYVFPPSLRQQTSSLVIVGASPVLLARAEAADRGWTTENVTTRYEAGIKASFAQWSLAEPSSAYLSQTGVALTASAGTAGNLKQIATQRYIAMYPDGIQGWSEWRRTGHPVLTPAPDATNSSKAIPRRYTYGTNDLVLTKDEITKAIARINGGDTMDGRVWWDK
jgi:hypothetical protein